LLKRYDIMLKASRRDYKLTDYELCMFTSNLVKSMERDEAPFALKGVSASDTSALEQLGNAYELFPADSSYKADLSIAVMAKDSARKSLEIEIRDIAQCATVKWGLGAPQYKKFGVAGMGSMGDSKFLARSRQAVTVANEYLAALTDVGLTQAMIDSAAAASQSFEEDMNAVSTAVETRDIKTAERIRDGNALYDFVNKYCLIGKIIWDDVDESKYNDYVIYRQNPLLPSTVQDLAYDVPAREASWGAAPGAVGYQLEFKMHTAGAEWGTAYEGSETSAAHDPGAGSWWYRCRGVSAQGSGEWSDELEVILPQ
jgi:hypothetical protein